MKTSSMICNAYDPLSTLTIANQQRPVTVVTGVTNHPYPFIGKTERVRALTGRIPSHPNGQGRIVFLLDRDGEKWVPPPQKQAIRRKTAGILLPQNR